ncbi:tbc domain-containing protein [Cystoisospora suis]|uniref:Tbc domain-containing protein n=1 Tax=Cystoisospora suis TaxID=483139 RepID=A0A2C6L645_9APIC|nr:tbc domain-containing protein [Cystoisospora suis]
MPNSLRDRLLPYPTGPYTYILYIYTRSFLGLVLCLFLCTKKIHVSLDACVRERMEISPLGGETSSSSSSTASPHLLSLSHGDSDVIHPASRLSSCPPSLSSSNQHLKCSFPNGQYPPTPDSSLFLSKGPSVSLLSSSSSSHAPPHELSTSSYISVLPSRSVSDETQSKISLRQHQRDGLGISSSSSSSPVSFSSSPAPPSNGLVAFSQHSTAPVSSSISSSAVSLRGRRLLSRLSIHRRYPHPIGHVVDSEKSQPSIISSKNDISHPVAVENLVSSSSSCRGGRGPCPRAWRCAPHPLPSDHDDEEEQEGPERPREGERSLQRKKSSSPTSPSLSSSDSSRRSLPSDTLVMTKNTGPQDCNTILHSRTPPSSSPSHSSSSSSSLTSSALDGASSSSTVKDKPGGDAKLCNGSEKNIDHTREGERERREEEEEEEEEDSPAFLTRGPDVSPPRFSSFPFDFSPPLFRCTLGRSSSALSSPNASSDLLHGRGEGVVYPSQGGHPRAIFEGLELGELPKKTDEISSHEEPKRKEEKEQEENRNNGTSPFPSLPSSSSSVSTPHSPENLFQEAKGETRKKDANVTQGISSEQWLSREELEGDIPFSSSRGVYTPDEKTSQDSSQHQGKEEDGEGNSRCTFNRNVSSSENKSSESQGRLGDEDHTARSSRQGSLLTLRRTLSRSFLKNPPDLDVLSSPCASEGIEEEDDSNIVSSPLCWASHVPDTSHNHSHPSDHRSRLPQGRQEERDHRPTYSKTSSSPLFCTLGTEFLSSPPTSPSSFRKSASGKVPRKSSSSTREDTSSSSYWLSNSASSSSSSHPATSSPSSSLKERWLRKSPELSYLSFIPTSPCRRVSVFSPSGAVRRPTRASPLHAPDQSSSTSSLLALDASKEEEERERGGKGGGEKTSPFSLLAQDVEGKGKKKTKKEGEEMDKQRRGEDEGEGYAAQCIGLGLLYRYLNTAQKTSLYADLFVALSEEGGKCFLSYLNDQERGRCCCVCKLWYSEINSLSLLASYFGRRGFPSSCRQTFWKLALLGEEIFCSPEEYQIVACKESRSDAEILRDVGRTFPHNPKFRRRDTQKSLERLLRAASNQFPHVGYCQGMNFVAAVLLDVMQDETTAYQCLASMLKNYQLELVYLPTLQHVKVTRLRGIPSYLTGRGYTPAGSRVHSPQSLIVFSSFCLSCSLFISSPPLWYLTLFRGAVKR